MTGFLYREFYDVPRIIVLRLQDQQFLLESQFNDSIDDYEDRYQVYLLPDIPEDLFPLSWEDLPRSESSRLGEIPVANVRFDETRRREMDAGCLKPFLKVTLPK